MSFITRDDRPPPKKDVFWVQCLKAGIEERFLIYSPQFQGVWTHWTGFKTTPCYKDHSRCFKQHDAESKRWLGYLFGFSKERNQPAFLQVPAESARMLLAQFQPGASIRGYTVDCRRRGGKKSPILMSVAENVRRRGDDLPMQQDCERSILHLWKVAEVDLEIDKRLIRHLDEIPDEEAA